MNKYLFTFCQNENPCVRANTYTKHWMSTLLPTVVINTREFVTLKYLKYLANYSSGYKTADPEHRRSVPSKRDKCAVRTRSATEAMIKIFAILIF